MKKILIVEDDLDIQEMIQFFLEDQSYQVCVAEDGVEGWQYLTKNIRIWYFWILCYLRWMGMLYVKLFGKIQMYQLL